MAALSQLGVLWVLTAGWGYWVWLLLRQPLPGRSLTWLWCGLAGFCLGLLCLQALVYFDLPLRKTAPAFFAFAGLGAGLLAVRLWRTGRLGGRRRWREAACILGAGLGASLGHSTSLMGIGSDRFIGQAQFDQANYVSTAQFLVEKPISTKREDIGLQPWQWRPLRLKDWRITQCVEVGVVAVLTRSDAQRVWGMSAIFFTMLLGMALAGMWRLAGAVTPGAALGLGLVGALLPVVAHVYLIGFFSQLGSLFIFPALIALCRPGALPLRVVAPVATILLGFLAGTYHEFWPIAIGLTAVAVLAWPVRPKLWIALGVTGGSLLLTSGFLGSILGGLLDLTQALQQNADLLSGFVPDGISWTGWAHNFVRGPGLAAILFGVLVAACVPLGIWLQPAHRRRHWLAVLACPALLLAALLLQSPWKIYVIYKLLATFAPIVVGCAALGLVQVAGRLGPGFRRGAVILSVLGGLWVTGSAISLHRELVRQSLGPDRDRLERLWAARDRAEASPGTTFLVANGNHLIGAWLAYFGRASEVYYDLPALSDNRVPSETAVFRKIPAGVPLTWLDLDLTGPVPPREPSPLLVLTGTRSSHASSLGRAYWLGPRSELTVSRAAGFAPEEREYVIEFGLTPVPGAGRCRFRLRGDGGVFFEREIEGMTPVSVPVRLRAGRTTLVMEVQSPDGAPVAEGDWLMLQMLSIEQEAIKASRP